VKSKMHDPMLPCLSLCAKVEKDVPMLRRSLRVVWEVNQQIKLLMGPWRLAFLRYICTELKVLEEAGHLVYE
jgi:hypothetical protein